MRRLWINRVERVEILTTEYTEVGEPILKITERSSVYSVWERSDLSVCFCGKKIAANGLTPSLTKRLTLTRSLASRLKGIGKSIHIS